VKERVYILATVRKPELIPAATLVFKTLRTGFPTAAVTVQCNGGNPESNRVLAECCRQANARLETGMALTQQDRWLARFIEVAHEPFWICDTDMVFFASMEGLNLPRLAGEYQPTFIEEYTRTIHVDRLHTALLRVDPVAVRDAVRAYYSQYPCAPAVEVARVLVHQTYVPTPDGILFYDTAAGLYHAIGGSRFSNEICDRFEHLQCATYIDLIGPHLEDAPGLAAMHQRIYADPKAAKGIRSMQQDYYRRRAPQYPHLHSKSL